MLRHLRTALRVLSGKWETPRIVAPTWGICSKCNEWEELDCCYQGEFVCVECFEILLDKIQDKTTNAGIMV